MAYMSHCDDDQNMFLFSSLCYKANLNTVFIENSNENVKL